MKNKPLAKYHLFTVLGVLLASVYPIYMGICIIKDYIINGIVLKENYPKYIIPYTPISLAVITGVLLMPLFIRKLKRFSLLTGFLTSVLVFFISEVFLERKIVIGADEIDVRLEDWQMYSCIAVPRPQTTLDILTGNYNPAFKLHFYMISIVLILSILNCLYGFGQMIVSGDKKRMKALIIQSVCSVIFLGLCILACFTAFWRTGSIKVSAVSAFLMTVFFILLGITSGFFACSFLLGKRKFICVFIPAIIASTMTLLMYIGEMILLNGGLYRFGTGFLFESINRIVLSPFDIFTIIISGCITAVGSMVLNKNATKNV